MDVNFSSNEEMLTPSTQLTGEKNKNKNKREKKVERKLKFRHLTDEMLEKYRRMSEESDLYKRQYEEAAFRVYGTLPASKTSFHAATKRKEKKNN